VCRCVSDPFAAVVLKVGLVGQEPVLFARTVEENITYGLTGVPREAVVQAAIKANAHEFISALPTGYQTSNHRQSQSPVLLQERGGVYRNVYRGMLCFL